MVFAVDGNRGAKVGPGKNLGNVGSFHIDATVGHGDTKIVVPVGAVKAVAELFGEVVVIKVEDVGDVG